MPLGELGTLVAKLGLDSSGLTRDVAEAKEKLAGGFEEAQHRVGAAMLGIGAAAAGLGLTLQHEAEADEQAHIRLQTAIENTGASYGAYRGKVEEAIGSGEHFGHNAADSQDALAKLTVTTGDTDQALSLMALTTEVAAFKHESLTQAAIEVGKAHEGSSRFFKQFGVQVSDNEKATGNYGQSLREVYEKIHGVAERSTDTFGGHLQQLRVKVEDAGASLGHVLGPALTTTGPLLMGVGAIIETGVVTKLAEMGSTALTAGVDLAISAGEIVASLLGIEVASLAAGTAMNLALGVTGVGAIALIGVAVYELATHWETIWHGIVDAVHAAADFIHDHTMLIVALFGPIGAVVELFSHNWETIWGTVKAVIADVASFISDHLGFIGKAFGVVGDVIGGVAGLFHHHHENMKADSTSLADGVEASGKRVNESADDIKKHQEEMAQATKDAAQRIKDSMDLFTASMDEATGSAVSLDKAGLDVANQLTDLSGRLREAGGSMDESTAKGRAAKGQFDDTVTSIQDYIKALQNSGTSQDDLRAKYDEQVNKLKAVMSAAGLTAGQIDDLITQYHLTPTDINTTVTLAGVADAEQQADALKGYLQRKFADPILQDVTVRSPTGEVSRVRAAGGPVLAGEAYLVGEKRPEVFVPDVSGHIIPRVPVGDGGGKSVTVSYAPSIVVHGGDANTAAQFAAILDAHNQELIRYLRSA